MPKNRYTEDNWRKDPWFRALCAGMLQCKTEEDMAAFLRDIGTLAELQAWGERLEVAKQLARGLTYRQVAKNTGASTTTVTRVAKYLQGGSGGYKRMLGSSPDGQPVTGDLGKIQKVSELKSTLMRKYLQPGVPQSSGTPSV